MYHLRIPKTTQEFQQYYHFRWKIFFESFHQPLGAERDAYDMMAHHRMVMNQQEELIAVGRLYINADNEASISFIAVHPQLQKHRIGTLLIMTLESIARHENVKRIVCSAYNDVVKFFIKQGFINQGELIIASMKQIRQFLMIKPIMMIDHIIHRKNWCNQLQQSWYQHIALSKKIGIRISQYTGTKFITTMPEIGNQNPHYTLFAGSLFVLATLTGWGLIWLLLREQQLRGTIILADAHIRYIKPLIGQPIAIADLGSLAENLKRLAQGRKTRLHLKVKLLSNDIRGAIFEGIYLVLPSLVKYPKTMLWL